MSARSRSTPWFTRLPNPDSHWISEEYGGYGADKHCVMLTVRSELLKYDGSCAKIEPDGKTTIYYRRQQSDGYFGFWSASK